MATRLKIMLAFTTATFLFSLFFDVARNRNFIGEPTVMDQGTVVKIQPEQHAWVWYDYEVNGARYSGEGSGPDGTKVGSKIAIYRSVAEPGISAPGDKIPTLAESATRCGLGALFVGTMVAIFAPLLFPRGQARPSAVQ